MLDLDIAPTVEAPTVPPPATGLLLERDRRAIAAIVNAARRPAAEAATNPTSRPWLLHRLPLAVPGLAVLLSVTTLLIWGAVL